MAQAANALRISELDFESIRNNLKEYLKNQSQFTDYDFDGSGMSVLLDILAYNTHYMGYYLNMVGNEAFLDTAQLRQSVVSHAKHINYVPGSMTAASVFVNVVVTPTGLEDTSTATLTLPKYTRFVSEPISGLSYTFSTVSANVVSKSGSSFTFTNVELKQGEPITQTYLVNDTKRFVIPSANVDTDTITVTVQQSAVNSQTEIFTLAGDITEVTGESPVFFLEENADANGTYTIQFGDGYLGKPLSNDNIVIINYLDTHGEYANRVNNFTAIQNIGGYSSNIVVQSIAPAAGGAAKETIEEIRFRAPIHYTVQNRAVTKLDYESLLLKDYPSVDAVSIWGGEEQDDPVYGKVYISLKPKINYEITLAEKERIKDEIIRTRSVLTVTPEIVDPDYTYLLINATVNYNPNLTNLDESELKSLVRQAIIDYKESDLTKFNSTFRLSRLQKNIDNAHESILGSTVKITAQKRLEIYTGESKNYKINYDLPLYRGYLEDKFYIYPAMKVTDLEGTERTVYIEDTPGSLTGIDSVDILTAGSNYQSAPTVTISGDGSGATATAKIINGKVSTITVVNRGSGYTIATASITGGDGSGASAKVNLQARNGILRTFYYKSNGEKIVVNDNAGTIDYLTGTINFISLSPNSLIMNNRFDDNILTINATPQDSLIRPQRNRILDIDEADGGSISITMIPEA